MKNLIQSSNAQEKRLELTAPAAVVSGEFVEIGSIPCAAVAALASGEKGTFVVEEVISYAKTGVFAEGAPVYFDGTGMVTTDGAGANSKVGLAILDDDGREGLTFKMLPEAL